MEVRLVVGDTHLVGAVPPFGPFAASYVVPAFFGAPSVEALVTNPFRVDIDDADLVAVLYDRDGNVQGGWHERAERLPASGAVTVSVDLLEAPPVPPNRVLLFPALTRVELQELR
jgi:hypothetical protein